MNWVDSRPRVALARATLEAALSRIESHQTVLAAAALLIIAANAALFVFHIAVLGDLGSRLGVDYRQYLFATDGWLHGAGFYRTWQLSGTYPIPKDPVTSLPDLPVLYPPVAILLFLPFTVLPYLWPLWWAIPLSFVCWFLVRMRPRPATWPVLAIFAVSGDTVWLLLSGNPIMWSVAAFAGGLIIGWPAVLVLLKPTMAPFALVGIRRRSWWIAIAALAAASLPFGTMWLDWLAAVRNSDGGLAYALINFSLFFLILIAWLGRRSEVRSLGGQLLSDGQLLSGGQGA